MIKIKAIIAVVAISFFSLSLTAQVDNENITKKLDKIYKQSSFPGFAVAVIKNDSILFSGAYGYANLREKVKFSENTIMPIASVSKTVIAFSLAKAFELGYFTEQTPINTILPFNISNPHHPNDTIRVEHLFTHTSGIIDDKETFISGYQLSNTPTIALGTFLEEHLDANGRSYSPNNFASEPVGTTYSYSNIAAALAAYLIEVKAKMPFHAFTEKYLFKPLNLQSTSWFYDQDKSDRYAKLYEINVPDLPYYKALMNADKSLKDYCSITYPDGSLRTSLVDLTAYLSEIMSGYQGRSKLMSKAYYAPVFLKRSGKNGQAITDKGIAQQAMFWNYNNKGRLTHNGSDAGVFAVVSIDVEHNIGRILLINANIDTDNNIKLINSIKEISGVLDTIY